MLVETTHLIQGE